MDFKQFDINGKLYTFVCNSTFSRGGFNHECEMFLRKENGSDVWLAKAKRHYLNRTWEKYTYQSVMLGAVNNELDWYTDLLKSSFMKNNGYKKMTDKRRKEFFEMILLNDAYFCELCELREELWK